MVEQQGSNSVPVAILVKSHELRDRIARIVATLGHNCEYITEEDLANRQLPALSLIIISVQGDVQHLSTLAERASRNVDARVLVISEDRDPQHIAAILGSGADDYALMPFNAAELAARIHSLIERARAVTDRHQMSISFMYPMRTITSGPMHLTFAPREWDVLIALLDAEGRQLSPRELAEEVWGDPEQEAAAISTVSRVRSRIQSGQFHAISIHTHRGAGYSATIHRGGEPFVHEPSDEDDHPSEI